MSQEVNFDALVGPTHNYSGLAYGNIASTANQQTLSNPRAAALQGLEKMWYLASLGLTQGIIPPQERPHLSSLRQLGFAGRDADILNKVWQASPELFLAVSSASSMWAANSATVSPSCDSNDGRVHITPANLISKYHRSIETPMTEKILKVIFPNPQYFTHHTPLPSHLTFSDEGAANHTRFARPHTSKGVQLFTYGRIATRPNLYLPQIYPARQTLEASQAVARLHQLSSNATIFVQQHPKVIDAGAFHNDVIAVGNGNVLLYHESAYIESEIVIEEIRSKVESICACNMSFIKVTEREVSLKEAIATYLFNSQICTLADGNMTLIAPTECQSSPSVNKFLEGLPSDPETPISQIHYVNIRESMRNGGGPACLRLRMVLTPKELAAVNQNFILTETLYEQLKLWITKHYRDKLQPSDLFDPHILQESREALNALTKILNVERLYEFQS